MNETFEFFESASEWTFAKENGEQTGVSREASVAS